MKTKTYSMMAATMAGIMAIGSDIHIKPSLSSQHKQEVPKHPKDEFKKKRKVIRK